MINAKDIKDRDFANDIIKKAEKIYTDTLKKEKDVIELIDSKM
jgi:glutamate formiminotransferase/formiminotetrahydrofolate cyclodeaminase